MFREAPSSSREFPETWGKKGCGFHSEISERFIESGSPERDCVRSSHGRWVGLLGVVFTLKKQYHSSTPSGRGMHERVSPSQTSNALDRQERPGVTGATQDGLERLWIKGDTATRSNHPALGVAASNFTPIIASITRAWP